MLMLHSLSAETNMVCVVSFVFFLAVLSTVLAAPADRNISSPTGEITFQSAYNVYLTQNFPSLNGKCPCLQNQTRPPVTHLPDTTEVDSKELKQMLSTVLETQRYLRKKFEILSTSDEEKVHVNNQTINALNIRLGYIDGKMQAISGHMNTTGKTLHEIQNRSRADSEEMVTILSDLLETQRAIRTELHSLSEAEEEKRERQNETMLSVKARLISLDKNARLTQIHNEKTEQNLKEIQRKLEYLYNQSEKVSLIEQMVMVDIRVIEEQERKLDQIIDFISNVSHYLSPILHCATKGVCLDRNGDYPIDCDAAYKSGGLTTGVYKIKPVGAPKPVDVYCDMSGPTKWTVIMSRYDGSVSFDRTWAEYKGGFGDVSKEHWLGLDTMYYLTNQDQYKARFYSREWQTKAARWAEFSTFKIGPESSHYKLTISGESGTATRGRMGYHNNRPFTTKDKDNDSLSGNCAVIILGGWWHGGCYHTFLTGPYTSRCASTKDDKCMCWDRNTPLDQAVWKTARI